MQTPAANPHPIDVFMRERRWKKDDMPAKNRVWPISVTGAIGKRRSGAGLRSA